MLAKKNLGSTTFFVPETLLVQNQVKFVADKCYMDDCLKHLGSSSLCEFWLLA